MATVQDEGKEVESVNAVEMAAECIPTGEVDDDTAFIADIGAEEAAEATERKKWHEDFWQKGWKWQYVLLGAATVTIFHCALKEMRCLGGKSVILQMLEEMDRENVRMRQSRQ